MGVIDRTYVGHANLDTMICDVLKMWTDQYPDEVKAIAHKTKAIRDGLINRKGISRGGTNAHLCEIPCTLHGFMVLNFGPGWVQDRKLFTKFVKYFSIGRVAENPVSEKGFLE